MNKSLRAFAAVFSLLVASLGLFVASANAATTVPGAPASCTASSNGDGTFNVAWERPTNDGGGVVWSYALKVKGQSTPVVRFDAANKQTESDARSYTWSHAVTGDPVVFQVRAINELGFGDWCEATVGDTTTPPPPAVELYLDCPEVENPYEGQEVVCTYRAVEQPPTETPNVAPTVSAGADLNVTLPGTASLNGTVSDDGKPAGASVTTTWSKVSGPGTVTFGNASNVDTTASFSTDGTYVLKLTASDTALSTSDEVQVVVSPEVVQPPTSSALLPYSAGSFFKSSVLNAPVNAARTTEMRNFMATHVDQKNTAFPLIRGVGGNNWGTPFAVGTASDPVWKLTGSCSNSRACFLGTQGFHAPEWLGDQLTGTSDSPFLVYDKAGGFTMMAANAEVVAPYTISATAWQVMYHDSNGLDYRNPLSDDDRNFTSRGRIIDAMAIRRDVFDEALANGTGLGHVLHMFISESKSADGHVHPMTGHESDNFGFGAQGERIRIKPSVNLESRGLSDFGLVIARTLQEHGMYIGDNSGGASGLKAEMSPNAWQGVSGVSANALQGLTWDDFEVVEQGWQ